MRRLPLILSATALAVALLGSTPLGQAALEAIPPLAKRALDADAVDGISASRTPRPGQLLALGTDGRLPLGVMPVGLQGSRERDIANLAALSVSTALDSSSPKSVTATCPAGKRVLGGGATVVGGGAAITQSQPVGGDAASVNAWAATAYEVGSYTGSWRLIAYALCATVAS